MRAFDYSSARSIDEVIDLLQGDAVRPLAGGTDLLTLIKADLAVPARLVDIKRAENLPRGIVAEQDGGVAIGTLTTLAEIEQSELLHQHYPALAQAAGAAATPQLRNMATVGGNMLQRPRCWYFRSPRFTCWLKGGQDCPARDGENQLHALFGGSPCVAVHPSDLASAMLAHDAEVRLRGPAGERTLPLSQFFALPEDGRRVEHRLAGNELLVALRLPPADGLRSVYLKAMDRKVWAFALVGVAAALRVRASAVEAARLVLSGVAPIPWRAEAAERALVGQPAGEAAWQAAADAALRDASPLAQNGYKLPLAATLIRRALAQAAVQPFATS
jgi:xanthine dehydrogenase YagS FAD-binding subunit